MSLLAVAEPEYLDYAQSKLLPHKISFDHNLNVPAHAQCAEPSFYPDANSAPSRLEDSRLGILRTASNSIMSTNGTVGGTADNAPLLPSREEHIEPASLSPSQTSSNWGLSPVHDSIYTWSTSSLPPTHFLWALKQLDSQYGGHSRHGLRNIPEIIEIGDSFLREDGASFIESFRHEWEQRGLWNRPQLSNPITSSNIAERIFDSLRCAEIIDYDSPIDPIRLRMARIFLYHYLEQQRLKLMKDQNLLSLSRGKNISSTVLDLTLEAIYSRDNQPLDPRTSEKRRESLKWHKRLGKRWSYLAAHLGIGIILTCSPSLEIQM